MGMPLDGHAVCCCAQEMLRRRRAFLTAMAELLRRRRAIQAGLQVQQLASSDTVPLQVTRGSAACSSCIASACPRSEGGLHVATARDWSDPMWSTFLWSLRPLRAWRWALCFFVLCDCRS